MKEETLSGESNMDKYLERYVDETMNAQVTRNGIFARDSFGKRVRRWLRMK